MKDKNTGVPISIDLVNISNSHTTIADMAECRLWRAVLTQSIIDMTDPDEKVKQDAMDYLNSDDLLATIDRAQIDRSYIISRIRELASNGYGMAFRTKVFRSHKAV